MVQIPFTTTDPLSVGRAAKELSLPRMTLYRWIAREKIFAFKLGGILFIPRSEIERLQNNEQPDATP